MPQDPDDIEDANDDFPRVPTDLLEALMERFPNQCPSISTPERELWAAVGRAEVVTFLRGMHQRPPTR